MTQSPTTKNPVPTLATKLAVACATGFGCGYAPRAPGTVGSLPGLILGFLMLYGSFSLAIRVAGAFLLTLVAVWSIALTEHAWDSHDDPRIVIDEVVGQYVWCLFLPATIIADRGLLTTGGLALLAFGIFRLLDIWKPGPIGWADAKLPGVWGTLTDDLIAGMLTSIGIFGVWSYVAS